MEKKDQLIHLLREEIVALEKRLRENLFSKMQMDGFRNASKSLLEEKEKQVQKLEAENKTLSEQLLKSQEKCKQVSEQRETLQRE